MTSWCDWRTAFAWLMAIGIASMIYFYRRHASSNSLGDQLGRSRIRSRILSHFGAGEICALKSRRRHFRQKCSNSVGAARCSEPYAGNRHKRMSHNDDRANVSKYSVETIEAMQKHLLSYRDNLRVEVEPGIPVAARTVAELRTLLPPKVP